MAIYINTYRCLRCHIQWESRYIRECFDECPKCAEDQCSIHHEVVLVENERIVLSDSGLIIEWMEKQTPKMIYYQNYFF